MIILIITVHIARVSMVDPRTIINLAPMAPHYAARALNDDLPISTRREAAGVGVLLRDVLGALHLANRNLQMPMPPLFRFRMLPVRSFSLFQKPRGYLEDL